MRNLLCILSMLICLPLFAVETAIQVNEHPTSQQANRTHSSAVDASTRPTASAPLPPQFEIKAKAWVLMDDKTGEILSAQNENEHLPPASLTKLMTAYVILQANEHGTVHLTDPVTVSEKAATTGGSKMFIRSGEKVSVENLMKGMIIQSGNDATVALAEHAAGSESAFVHIMNQTAEQLGMTNSHFTNPNGLPNDDQYVSAFDMAQLSRALIHDFPKAYKWYSERTFTWNGITQQSRNRLLWRDPRVDGLKTGYTQAAKYCLVASAKDDGMRLIGVILGADSANARIDEMQRLLNFGFRFYQNHTLYSANEPIEKAPVKGGTTQAVPVGTKENVVVTVPKGHYDNLSAKVVLSKQLVAPLKAGQQVGQLYVTLGTKHLTTLPVYTLSAISEGSWWDKIKSWFA